MGTRTKEDRNTRPSPCLIRIAGQKEKKILKPLEKSTNAVRHQDSRGWWPSLFGDGERSARGWPCSATSKPLPFASSRLIGWLPFAFCCFFFFFPWIFFRIYGR